MLVEEMLKQAKKVYIGTKQTKKALEKEEAQLVLVARNAEKRVIDPILKLCEEKEIEIVFIATMEELGRLCDIEVGSATAAIVQ